MGRFWVRSRIGGRVRVMGRTVDKVRLGLGLGVKVKDYGYYQGCS